MHKKGFTLIELSIVLVIIGLLIGGVLVGRDLLRGSELRGTMSQKEKFDAATNTFRIKYNCLPGDCANATNFGFAENGNGDGQVGLTNGYASSSPYMGFHDEGNTPTWNEMIGFWVQLGDAGLIDGRFTLPTPDPSFPALEGTVPKSKSGNGGYWWLSSDRLIRSSDGSESLWVNPPIRGKHVFWLTGSMAFDSPGAATLLPADAFAIDAKMDDGMPFTGNVRATNNISTDVGGPSQFSTISQPWIVGSAGSAKCVNSDATPAQYNITATEVGSDCANDFANCNRCGLVLGASF